MNATQPPPYDTCGSILLAIHRPAAVLLLLSLVSLLILVSLADIKLCQSCLCCCCRGELPEGAAAEYESSRKAYEGLHRAVTAMAEALDKQLPDLAEDAFTRWAWVEGGGGN
jgi:hypothetical protein